jgi:hypothetical protein
MARANFGALKGKVEACMQAMMKTPQDELLLVLQRLLAGAGKESYNFEDQMIPTGLPRMTKMQQYIPSSAGDNFAMPKMDLEQLVQENMLASQMQQDMQGPWGPYYDNTGAENLNAQALLSLLQQTQLQANQWQQPDFVSQQMWQQPQEYQTSPPASPQKSRQTLQLADLVTEQQQQQQQQQKQTRQQPLLTPPGLANPAKVVIPAKPAEEGGKVQQNQLDNLTSLLTQLLQSDPSQPNQASLSQPQIPVQEHHQKKHDGSQQKSQQPSKAEARNQKVKRQQSGVPTTAGCDSMKDKLKALERQDPATILIARRIHRLGFSSADSLEAYLNQYAKVDSIHMAHSHVKTKGWPEGHRRLRPAAVGFIVMDSLEDAAKVLAMGSDHTINNISVSINAFVPRTYMGEEKDSGKEESEEADTA